MVCNNINYIESFVVDGIDYIEQYLYHKNNEKAIKIESVERDYWYGYISQSVSYYQCILILTNHGRIIIIDKQSQEQTVVGRHQVLLTKLVGKSRTKFLLKYK